MREEILSIASDLREGSMSTSEAKEQLLVLFGIVGQSEQLVCDCPIPSTTMELPHRCIKCNKPIKWD